MRIEAIRICSSGIKYMIFWKFLSGNGKVQAVWRSRIRFLIMQANLKGLLLLFYVKTVKTRYFINGVEVTQQLISEKPQKQVFSRFSSLSWEVQ